MFAGRGYQPAELLGPGSAPGAPEPRDVSAPGGGYAAALSDGYGGEGYRGSAQNAGGAGYGAGGRGGRGGVRPQEGQERRLLWAFCLFCSL